MKGFLFTHTVQYLAVKTVDVENFCGVTMSSFQDNLNDEMIYDKLHIF